MIIISIQSRAQLTLNMTPSQYNGYNISCFGWSDGSIDLTISGGVPPYTIVWSTTDSIEDLSNLPAGYYRVQVTDSDSVPNTQEAEITLTEPRQIRIEGSFFVYPNGYHISVYGACNGMVSLTATEGVGPYIWLWNDSTTTPNRTALCAGWYSVTATDANGCRAWKEGYLKEPVRGDWLLNGNAGTNPNADFLGTVDSTDLTLRTNNQERMRLRGDGRIEILGDLKIDSTSADSIRLVFVDSAGVLRTSVPPPSIPDWSTMGNSGINDQDHYIGTNNDADLVFKTSTFFSGPTEKMRITQGGGVGIGSSIIPANYKLIVNGNVGAREIVIVKHGDPWPDYVFSKEYQILPLNNLRSFIEKNKHLPGMPSADDIENEGGFKLGLLQLKHLEKTEEAYLYILELKNEIEILKEELTQVRKMLSTLK